MKGPDAYQLVTKGNLTYLRYVVELTGMRVKVYNEMEQTNCKHRIFLKKKEKKRVAEPGEDFLLSKLGHHYFSCILRDYVASFAIADPLFCPSEWYSARDRTLFLFIFLYGRLCLSFVPLKSDHGEVGGGGGSTADRRR